LNQAMKQRLIGTVVLGCLALIFIPILLDGEGVQDPTPLPVTVPPAPEITITPLPEPVRPIILSDTDALNIDNTATTSPPADQQVTELEPRVSPEANPPALVGEDTVSQPQAQPDAVTEPQLTTQGLPQGWSVRLGTFSNRTNAEALVASLILENYKAYSRPVQSGSQTMLAVYVGPVLTQVEATRLQEQLKNEQQLKDTVVVPFTIDTPVQRQ
jgi:DedD protein